MMTAKAHARGRNPGIPPCCHRGQTEQEGAHEDVPDEKLPELDGAHRKPAPAFAQNGHGGVINGQKAGRRFIENVQPEGHA